MPATLTRSTSRRERREIDMPVRAPRQARRRARATLGWALTTFVLCQLGLRLVIDGWLPEWRDPAFEARARQLAECRARSPGAPATVLMVGSSITGSAFKAQYLEGLLAKELNVPAAVVNFGR